MSCFVLCIHTFSQVSETEDVLDLSHTEETSASPRNTDQSPVEYAGASDQEDEKGSDIGTLPTVDPSEPEHPSMVSSLG